MSAVVDTSVLIALGHLRLLRLLPQLFDEVIIPQAVFEEWLEGDPKALDAVSAAEGLERGWLEVRPAESVLPDLRQRLGRGEAEVAEIAESTGADFAVIDDRAARGVAASMGLQVIGTVGVLVAARGRGTIPAALPLLETLQRRGFRLSDEVLAAVRHDEEP